jgi:hypothetical protein
MTQPPIIEVYVGPGDNFSYKLRPAGVSTKDYGEVFASLLRHVANMLAIEGNFVKDDLEREIRKFMNQELDHPTTQGSMRMLQ